MIGIDVSESEFIDALLSGTKIRKDTTNVH